MEYSNNIVINCQIQAVYQISKSLANVKNFSTDWAFDWLQQRDQLCDEFEQELLYVMHVVGGLSYIESSALLYIESTILSCFLHLQNRINISKLLSYILLACFRDILVGKRSSIQNSLSIDTWTIKIVTALLYFTKDEGEWLPNQNFTWEC